MLRRFELIEQTPAPIWAWILVIFVIFVFPGIGIRAFHYEEGYVAAVARGAIEDGYWLTPHIYGARYVERPHLMAWTVAVLGMFC